MSVTIGEASNGGRRSGSRRQEPLVRARRRGAPVVDIIRSKTTVPEALCAYALPPSEIEGWVDDAKRMLENALRANPLEIRE